MSDSSKKKGERKETVVGCGNDRKTRMDKQNGDMDSSDSPVQHYDGPILQLPDVHDCAEVSRFERKYGRRSYPDYLSVWSYILHIPIGRRNTRQKQQIVIINENIFILES